MAIILVAFCHPLAFPKLQVVNIFIIVGLNGDNSIFKAQDTRFLPGHIELAKGYYSLGALGSTLRFRNCVAKTELSLKCGKK